MPSGAPGEPRVPDRDIFIPTTISPQSQQAMRELAKQKLYARVAPAPGDLEAWRKAHQATEVDVMDRSEKAVERSGVAISEIRLGNVPALDVRPKDWKDNGKILIYTHGGGYTMFSARSSLVNAAPMSRATGLRIISVDYTTAPFAKWREIQ